MKDILEHVQHNLDNGQYPGAQCGQANQIALDQLALTAELLKEMRALRQFLDNQLPREPVRVNVEGAVQVL